MNGNSALKDIETIKELLAPIFQKNEVIKAMVFGSTARASKTRKSDLDLMIIKETGKRFFDRYDEFDEIFDLIKDRAIDILIYTPEELENISHRPFIKMIIKEGIPIYEH
jgi:predicted nucleotidyltransferase